LTVALDSLGNIYTANNGSNNVTKLSSTGVLLGTYPVGGVPHSLTLDKDDTLYVGDYTSNAIKKMSSTGLILATYPTAGNVLFVTIDSLDNIYSVDYGLGVTKISIIGVKDLARNYNLASTSTDNSITYSAPLDTVSPIVTLSGSSTLTIAQGSIYTDA
jgi:hypothetical protein